jgi:hypothetical protein
LVKIIVAVARGRLLFDRAAHWNSVLWIDYSIILNCNQE